MQGRPRRSSIKCTMVSVIDESITERPPTRRVSFAPIISVCGMEDKVLLGSFSDDCDENSRLLNTTTALQDVSIEDSSDMSLSDSLSMKPASSANVLPMMDETWELSPSTFLCATPINAPSHDDSDAVLDSSSSMTIQECGMSSVSRSQDSTEHHKKSPLVESQIQSKSDDSFTDVTSVTPTNCPKFIPSSERKSPNYGCFSEGRVTSSLPPLRHHHGMPAASHITPRSSRATTSDRSLSSGLSVSRGKLGSADQLLSQSLVNTPLRQVASKCAVQGGQKGNQLSIFNDGTRRDPSRFLPSVDRLQSHALRLSVYDPCQLSFSNFGVSPSSLTNFLSRHPCVPNALPGNPSFPGKLNDLERFQPHLYEEFLDLRKSTELSCTENIAQFIHMAHCRKSSILLDHSQSLPVVQQLSKMNGTELITFLAEAHEKLYTAELFARHSLLELKNTSLTEYKAEQEHEHDRIEKLIGRLDREELLLQRAAEQLDSELKSYQLIETTWTDYTKRSETVGAETNELKKTLTDTLAETVQLAGCLREISKRNSISISSTLPPIDRAVGASSLFPSPNATSIRSRSDVVEENAEVSKFRIANLLFPCVVDCLSFAEQKYSLRTLFGLVSFHVACNSVQSMIQGKQKLHLITMENLIVTEVVCCTPPSHLLPAECESVKAFADQIISFFNTREIRAKLQSMLIGTTLDKVIKVVGFLMSPYLVMAADLRAMFWAGHGVYYSPADLPPLPSSQQPSHHSLTTEPSQCRSYVGIDSRPPDRLIPTYPISITVTVFSQAAFSIIRIHFLFPSIEVDAAANSVTSASVLYGPIDPEQVRTFLESRKTLPGGMYRTVCEMLKLLPSWKIQQT